MSLEESRNMHEQSENSTEFDRGKCMFYTLRSHQPSFTPQMSEGKGFERMYLGKDVKTVKHKDKIKIPHLTPQIDSFIYGLIALNSTSPLTDEQFSRISDSLLQQEKNIGNTIKDRASDLGLVDVQSSAQVSSRVNEESSFTVNLDKANPFSIFRNRGWAIFPTKNNSFLCVVPDSQEGEIVQLNTIDMNHLFKQDPDFVKKQINKYYELQGMANVLSEVRYNLKLHNIDEDAILPSILKHFSTNPVTRKRELQQLARFLNWTEELGGFFTISIENFTKGLKSRSYMVKRLENDGEFARLSSYLSHMKNCPTIKDAQQRRFAAFQEAQQALTSVQLSRFEPRTILTGDNLFSSEQHKKILENPITYTNNYISALESHKANKQEKDRKFAQFIEDTESIKDPDLILQAMKVHLPETYTLIKRFTAWINAHNPSTLTPDRFKEIITYASHAMEKENGIITLNSVHHAVQQALIHRYGSAPSGSFPHVQITWNSAQIYNEELEDTLALLVIKSAQRSTQRDIPAILENDRKNAKKEAELLESTIHDLKQKYKIRVLSVDKDISKLEASRTMMARFCEEMGIPVSQAEELATLSRTPEKDNDLLPAYDVTSFTIAFNALVMDHLGVLDIKSPAFIALVKEVFPEMNNDILVSLQTQP